MTDTIIKQYGKRPNKEYIAEFYNYVFSTLNNLIDTDLEKNLKLVFISYLINENTIVFFKNKHDKLQIGRLSRVITRDENFLPIDLAARTFDGTMYNLIEGEYVIYYNPIPISYLRTKIEEISGIEKITNYLRKLYKVPVIFQSKDSKGLKAIKDFIKRIFSVDDEVCTITNDGIDLSKQINKIDLKIDYITDKLLDENESLKEDILEILGIYKNTSSNRERVNEQELIIANSLTTVNKLGLEDSLKILFNEIESVLGFKYSVDLNINKIFDAMKGDE